MIKGSVAEDPRRNQKRRASLLSPAHPAPAPCAPYPLLRDPPVLQGHSSALRGKRAGAGRIGLRGLLRVRRRDSA
eukprot:15471448-Alexandrium_andersonii.AAC.1